MYNKKIIITTTVLSILMILIGLPMVFGDIIFIGLPALGVFLLFISIMQIIPYTKAKKLEDAKNAELKRLRELMKNPKERESVVSKYKDLTSEYKNLLDSYTNLNTSREYKPYEMVYILKKCYEIMQDIFMIYRHYMVQPPLDPAYELMRIEKKAKTFIYNYIEHQRENGYDDHMIDVVQFADDLNFIDYYIYERHLLLNKK